LEFLVHPYCNLVYMCFDGLFLYKLILFLGFVCFLKFHTLSCFVQTVEQYKFVATNLVPLLLDLEFNLSFAKHLQNKRFEACFTRSLEELLQCHVLICCM